MRCVVHIILMMLFTFGCETQKVEYRTRPAWHQSLGSSMPNEFVREDGTIVKYDSSNQKTTQVVTNYLNTLKLKEIDEFTGEVTLRAVLPEHVLKQTLTCLRDRDWKLLFEHVLSKDVQDFYNRSDEGRTEFIEYFENNRRELAKSLQRIHKGRGFGDVFTSTQGNLTILSLSPRIAKPYLFKSVTLIREGEFLKLHNIE